MCIPSFARNAWSVENVAVPSTDSSSASVEQYFFLEPGSISVTFFGFKMP